MSAEFAPGLAGVVAAKSAIGLINGQEGILRYRGIRIEALAENSSFEEVSYLLLFGKLPTAQELAGFEAELVDGASHDVDSSVLAFEIAGRAAFREAMNKASPKLLEPVMKVEVLTPEEYMGDIIGDLNSRRGNVGGMNQRGNARAIDAMVPLANMFGYINTLRSMSQGRAQYSMTFDHYEQVPQAVADEVRAKMA